MNNQVTWTATKDNSHFYMTADGMYVATSQYDNRGRSMGTAVTFTHNDGTTQNVATVRTFAFASNAVANHMSRR
jgi:hypothetical protein